LGLEGHIETAISHNGKLYVGTNEGLFQLEEVKEYKELIERKSPTPRQQLRYDEAKEKKKERFNFRNFLKRRKIDTLLFKSRKKVVLPTLIKKKILTAIKYEYVRVGGIKGKCNQLIIVGKKLMAATNMGVYEIENGVITKICDNNIRHLFASKSQTQMYASTTDGEIITFSYNGIKWELYKLFDFVTQPITCISEDIHNNLWLAGISKVYRVRMGRYNEIVNKSEIEIYNPYSDDIHLFNYNKKFYFFISSHFYYYNPNTDKLTRDSVLYEKYKYPENVIYSQNNALWILKNKFWELLADAYPRNENFIYLSLFKNVDQYVIDTEHHSVWVLTDKNQLYRLNLHGTINALSKPDILVYNVQNAKGQYLSINNFSVQQDESNLLLNVVSPDYYNQNALDYQYKIQGHSQEWSHWSNSNTIILNYLPSGSYAINVRSRNAFGQMTEKEAVRFTIEPPFWQKWWFYLAEVFFFGTLWLLSFKLNRTNSGNQFIRKSLTFLTLVITIEFLSTAVESIVNLNISPVLDFLVKVCIALILIPIERFLSRFIATRNHPFR
ncbi:MAG TPA: triple tyrosine motif-containing protein, partial [Cytophagales bacterium]|nr:triple tyrosine motif-containing protein [Cytophagales bacterium]